jgi:hypothetical protein
MCVGHSMHIKKGGLYMLVQVLISMKIKKYEGTPSLIGEDTTKIFLIQKQHYK